MASTKSRPSGAPVPGLDTVREWAHAAGGLELEALEGTLFVRGLGGPDLRDVLVDLLKSTARVQRVAMGIELNLLSATLHAETQGVTASEVAAAIGMSRQAVGYKAFRGSPDSNTVVKVKDYTPNVRRRVGGDPVELPDDRLVDADEVEEALRMIEMTRLTSSKEGQILITGTSPSDRKALYLASLAGLRRLWSMLGAAEDRLILLARMANMPVAEIAKAVGQSRQSISQRIKSAT